jgi:3-oxoacyl-[acyl-carrier-protein] synthase II
MKDRPLKRVVVTGMGVIGPLGFDAEQMFQRLLRGESGIRRLGFDAPYMTSKIGGVVKDFDLRRFISDRASLRNARMMDPPQQWALSAAHLAMTDAGLEKTALGSGDSGTWHLDSRRLGVCLGAGLAGRSQAEEVGQRLVAHYDEAVRQSVVSSGDFAAWLALPRDEMMRAAHDRLVRQMNPASLLQQLPSVATAYIAMRYRAMGPNITFTSLCAAGAQAIGESAWMIARGDADCMLAGGADSMLNPLDLTAFARLDAVTSRNDEVEGACKPFDLKRDGCVVGEGAAMLVLESAEHARKRGARVYAEVAGYGSTDDAYKISAPPDDGEGAYLSMRRALDSAGLRPVEIDHVNAHGTATLLNDRIETVAIKRALGDHAWRVPVVATKSMTGHLIAAAGALEAIISIKSLQHGKVPPTINLHTPDPLCNLDYVAEGARELPGMTTVLSNSFAFGGVNATLIFRRGDGS